MRLLFSLLTVNLKQAIISIPFLLSVCGVAGVIFFSTLRLMAGEGDVVYLYGMGTGGGSVFLIAGILPLFAFSSSFASDWEQRVTSFWIIRTGIRNYAISKVVISALSGFLVTLCGLLMYILIMQVKLPLYSGYGGGGSYDVLLDLNKPISFLFFDMTHIALTSALFAVVAVWVSTYFTNKFAAIASPLVIYFIVHRFTTQLDIPHYLKAMYLVESIYVGYTPLIALFIKLVSVLVLCLLMGLATVRQIKRKVQHD